MNSVKFSLSNIQDASAFKFPISFCLLIKTITIFYEEHYLCDCGIYLLLSFLQ